MLRGDTSEPAPVDVIGFSMGALVVRSYLAGKQTEPGVFSPPANPLVRKTILVAAENFGAPLAGSAPAGGEQIPQLRVGSRFLWDLATWHQGLDDLRETDALAILGVGARDASGDGVAPALGASISAPAFFGIPPERTRILSVCHNAPAAFSARPKTSSWRSIPRTIQRPKSFAPFSPHPSTAFPRTMNPPGSRSGRLLRTTHCCLKMPESTSSSRTRRISGPAMFRASSRRPRRDGGRPAL